MSRAEALALGLLRRIDPERAHGLALSALRRADVVWDKSLPLGAAGHIFPEGVV